MTAAEISPEWVKALAKCLSEGAYAFRKGPHATIEIQSQSAATANQWLPKMLPNHGTHFATERDRDQIYNALRALQ